MSLPVDAAPPGHLPPAASAPWPLQPPPHGAAARSIPVRPIERRKGPFGMAGALVAAAAAATVGLAVAIPLLVSRKAKPAPKRARGRGAKA